jgi:hypothetical protein
MPLKWGIRTIVFLKIPESAESREKREYEWDLHSKQFNLPEGDYEMARLKADCVLMGVQKNTGKDQKVYATATLYFPDDKSSMPIGLDHKNPTLLAQTEGLEMVTGTATIGVREYKGTRYLDLVAFERKK